VVCKKIEHHGTLYIENFCKSGFGVAVIIGNNTPLMYAPLIDQEGLVFGIYIGAIHMIANAVWIAKRAKECIP